MRKIIAAMMILCFIITIPVFGIINYKDMSKEELNDYVYHRIQEDGLEPISATGYTFNVDLNGLEKKSGPAITKTNNYGDCWYTVSKNTLVPKVVAEAETFFTQKPPYPMPLDWDVVVRARGTSTGEISNFSIASTKGENDNYVYAYRVDLEPMNGNYYEMTSYHYIYDAVDSLVWSDTNNASTTF